MRISDWSSDVCSSDLPQGRSRGRRFLELPHDPRPLTARLLTFNLRGVAARLRYGLTICGRVFMARIAIVTGGSRGIGEAISLALQDQDRKSTRLNSSH